MPAETAKWLVQQREERGWSRPQMARELIKAGQALGYKQLPEPDSLKQNIFRWEHGTGVSHEYVTLYCHVLGIDYREFPRQERTRSKPKASTALVVRDHPQVPGHGQVTYRGYGAPVGDSLEHEVMMTAHESSDHAAEHERHGIGDTTLEQLRADVMRLSRQTDTGSPLAAFMDTRRVRDRIYRLLDRRLWPREQADLYFLLACAHAVMGQNANRLGYPDAAEELIRSGWAYANVIDHNPLRAMLRAKLSSFDYWRGRFREASDLAADGLRYVPDGPSAAELRLNYARAMARQGDVDAARHAVRLGQDAQVSGYRDDLMEIGGNMFSQYLTTMHTVAGNALGDTGNDSHDAAGELESAISLYNEDPAPGENHTFFGKSTASTHLALVRLRSGELDGAVTALADVLSVPPQHRITELTTRLAVVRDELATPAFQGSPQARDLGDQIENFSREAVAASLHSLSG
jgi:hypothetical protein